MLCEFETIKTVYFETKMAFNLVVQNKEGKLIKVNVIKTSFFLWRFIVFGRA